MRILILGASGSGTTTLGNALAARLGWVHLDTDSYYWLPTSPPYQQKRDPVERLDLLERAVRDAHEVVVSGSLMGWGESVEDGFDLVVFLYVPTTLRLERLRKRETMRHGTPDPEFLQWASEYDEGPAVGRSLAKHRAWLAARRCPVLMIEGDTTVEERLRRVVAAIGRR